MEDVTIRAATEDDIDAISELLTGLAERFITPDYTTAGRRHLLAEYSSASIRDHMRDGVVFMLAEHEDRVVGVVGIGHRRHLWALFTAADYQRRGIARRLWKAATGTGIEHPFTVNASRYAVPVYERLGFVAVGPEKISNGVIFQPMVLEGGDVGDD